MLVVYYRVLQDVDILLSPILRCRVQLFKSTLCNTAFTEQN